MTKYRFISIALLVVISLSLAGCGNSALSIATPAVGTAAAGVNTTLRKVRIVMGYIPNVQFAAYYVAVEKGYYKDVGLEVNFDYAQVNDALALTGQGSYEFAIASGDEVLVARDKGVPVVYVMAQYQRYPIALFSKAEANIRQPRDLVGKRVGIPGKYGSNYIALQAMLYANKIAEQDVNIMSIGYTQAQSVASGQVDAAIGYAMNEPIALTQQGVKLNVIQAADQYNLASVGLVTAQKMLDSDATTVQAFVKASVRGLQDVNTDPNAAFTVVGKYVKEAADPANAAFQRASLVETVKFQTPPSSRQPGEIDPQAWADTAKFLSDAGTIKAGVDVTKAYTNQFVK